MRVGYAACVSALWAGIACAAASDEGSAQTEPGLFERERLTGEWWGARTSLEEAGLSFSGQYVAEFNSVLDGGLNEVGSFRNILTIDATLDLGAAFGLEGGTLYVQYLSVNGETGGTLDTGDIQVYSNIESDRSMDVIYEAWWEQLFLDDRLRIKAGKIDANSEYAFVDAAGGFANSSAGFSPTIVGFPTYPDPAFGVNAFYTFGDRDATHFTLGYGLFDGALAVDGERTGRLGPGTFFSDDRSDDYAHVVQGELEWAGNGGDARWFREGRASLGLLHHTGDFTRFDGDDEDGTTSFFATVEQRLYATARTEDSGVYVFGQYGWADEDVSEIAQHVGAGVVLRSTFPGRDDDEAGVYVTYVDLSDATGTGFDDDETAIDVYYTLRLTPAVFVQPEVQYVFNPAGDDTIDDALVIGLRVGLEF